MKIINRKLAHLRLLIIDDIIDERIAEGRELNFVNSLVVLLQVP